MKIPKEITKDILDEMIPVWEGLAENGWDGVDPYLGLCGHFDNLGIKDTFDFIKKHWFNGLTNIGYLRPTCGKEGAQKRVEILKQIRAEL